MDKQTLKKYFKLCKKYDHDNIKIIVFGAEKGDINDKYPDLTDDDINNIKYMKNMLGDDDKLMKIYDMYHLKGGELSLSKITNLLKKNINPQKIKSTMSTITKGAKKLIEASAPVIAEAVINNPDVVIDMVNMVHTNITIPIINSSFKDENKRKKITDSFDIAIKAFDSGIRSANEAKTNIDKNKVKTGGKIYDQHYNSYQFGGRHSYDDDENYQSGSARKYYSSDDQYDYDDQNYNDNQNYNDQDSQDYYSQDNHYINENNYDESDYGTNMNEYSIFDDNNDNYTDNYYDNNYNDYDHNVDYDDLSNTSE